MRQPWEDDPPRPCDTGACDGLCNDCDEYQPPRVCDWRACAEQDCDNCDAASPD